MIMTRDVPGPLRTQLNVGGHGFEVTRPPCYVSFALSIHSYLFHLSPSPQSLPTTTIHFAEAGRLKATFLSLLCKQDSGRDFGSAVEMPLCDTRKVEGRQRPSSLIRAVDKQARQMWVLTICSTVQTQACQVSGSCGHSNGNSISFQLNSKCDCESKSQIAPQPLLLHTFTVLQILSSLH